MEVGFQGGAALEPGDRTTPESSPWRIRQISLEFSSLRISTTLLLLAFRLGAEEHAEHAC